MPSGLTSLQFVTVGNPGNAGELSGAGAGGYGPDRVCGAVAYTYKMGKFEVTAGQYCAFLNAVAGIDTYGVYVRDMDTTYNQYGCNIKRTGNGTAQTPYTYSVANDWANRPVNFVSWGDAARFANWLHNGQPTGTLTGNPAQDAWLTEDGSYYLNGATTTAQLLAITRKDNATWVIPSEDEWYKAAYHKNDGVTGNYWDYPTGTNTAPSNQLIDPDPGNNANYAGHNGHTIGAPYYRTPVGEFENSESPYGTFDQGGNLWEWNEAILSGSYRGLRGGGFNAGDACLHAAYRNRFNPEDKVGTMGFRIVEIPEPGCAGLFLIGCLLSARRGRRSKYPLLFEHKEAKVTKRNEL